MKMKLTTGTALVAAAAIGLALWLPNTAMARVSGNCVNCHTMHNSQDGGSMQPDGTSGPQPALTRGGCVECHTGTNLDGDGIPKVLSDVTLTNEATSLAGGNFAWITQIDDTRGHNVVGTSAAADDPLATIPPGGVQMVMADGTTAITRMTCAGTAGCHGDRTMDNEFASISGSHHYDDTAGIDATSALDVGGSYRFLKGILGKEDSDWEFEATVSTHNQYYGVDNPNVTNTATISSLCAQCHTDFHNDSSGRADAGVGTATGTAASPFVRHPTDLDLGSATGTEYAAYTAYSLQAPVASTTYTTVLETVQVTPGDAVVMCISCHRAHGTPNADLLRWDYAGMQAHVDASAGTGAAPGTGCFVCHTTKDGV